MNLRTGFYKHIAQTSDAPLEIEPEYSNGIYIYTKKGKKLIDLISGIAVSSLGHSHPKIVKAVQNQASKYMHLMVYGEFIEQPQVLFANALASSLGKKLNNIYFTNSGAEATEGAMKLAKKYTKKPNIVYFKNSYHGSTQGALSVLGDEFFKTPFRPLLPGTFMLEYGKEKDLLKINSQTAAVIIEPIQAEAGVLSPPKNYLRKVLDRCKEVGALLVLDECQTGMGRTGSLFAFQQTEIQPDILLLAKALGGGMPLGCFVSSKNIMKGLQNNPFLGHITTFGGHPVSCAAGLAAFQILTETKVFLQAKNKAALFKKYLKHELIKDIRVAGLLIAVEFTSFEINKRVIAKCLENGVLTDWFLFNSKSLRIAPPLTISEDEIKKACMIINQSIDEI